MLPSVCPLSIFKVCWLVQGGIESWADYAYCSGGEKDGCFPCDPPGYNKTLCGPRIPYCLKNESCAAKIDPAKFVPGLKIVDWKAISKVGLLDKL